MCGIVGIVGKDRVSGRLIESLKRLEYRGYDSAGIAILKNGTELDRRRAKGKIVNLEAKLKEQPLDGHVGIAHTRWATHGVPNEGNAHPHSTAKVAVVHNGIIENYQELKAELMEKQVRFETETDTEVIAHLVTDYINGGDDPQTASYKTFKRLRGAYALAMIFTDHDNLMIGTRKGTPLVLGYGSDEVFLASDAYALAPLTNRICFLEDGDSIIIQGTDVKITANDNDEDVIERPIKLTQISGAMTGKGEYKHFMLKEIYEQPAVIAETLSRFVNPERSRVFLPECDFDLANAPKLTIIACGTAFYAGMVAKNWFERIARMQVEVDIASEFRYRKAPMPEGGVALFISQSGETLDTLEALRYAKGQGQYIISILNTPESTIARESDFVLQTLAGPEIGVASTKAFTTQLTTLACMAFSFARSNKVMSGALMEKYAHALRELPSRTADILNHDEEIKEIAHEIMEARDVLYLGRGSAYPIALEGALKLKEISYIHAEGYAAGELKHGPIALIDESVPVIVVAPYDDLFEKTKSNVQEVVARGGKAFVISNKKGVEELKDVATWTITLPDVEPFIAPILYTIPVQLLAYHVAVLKGTDVDQPRNLAKAVTVE